MIFTSHAISETISTRREISGGVAWLLNKSERLCSVFRCSAVSGLLGPNQIRNVAFLCLGPSHECCRKTDGRGRNVFRDVLFNGSLIVRKAARLFRCEDGAQVNTHAFFVEVFRERNSNTSKQRQSSEYQSHINPLRISPNKARLPHFGNGEGMIMVQHSAPLVNLPLFIAPEQAEINRLQAERETLQRRINLMRPHSHKRVELEARLRTVTAQQLTISAELGRNQ